MKKKFLVEWECIVTEVNGDVVYCNAYALGNDEPEEFWELIVPGHKWTEGHVFYVLHSKEEQNDECDGT